MINEDKMRQDENAPEADTESLLKKIRLIRRESARLQEDRKTLEDLGFEDTFSKEEAMSHYIKLDKEHKENIDIVITLTDFFRITFEEMQEFHDTKAGTKYRV
jgi:hypothetical protein